MPLLSGCSLLVGRGLRMWPQHNTHTKIYCMAKSWQDSTVKYPSVILTCSELDASVRSFASGLSRICEGGRFNGVQYVVKLLVIREGRAQLRYYAGILRKGAIIIPSAYHSLRAVPHLAFIGMATYSLRKGGSIPETPSLGS